MADLTKALDAERAIDAAYMRGYRAARRKDPHEECSAEIRDLRDQLAKRDHEIEILKRLIKGE